MKFKINIRHEVKFAVVLVVVFGLIAFTERMKGDVAVRDIRINIENVNENHFLDEADILGLMQSENPNVIGANVNSVNFKSIENRIKRDRFIKDTELYSDLKGNLTVRVEMRRPIARIVRNNGLDGYVAEDGTIMPVSDKFTSRVVLLSGAYADRLLVQENILETESGMQLMGMLEMIRDDQFWNAQITELDIDHKGRIVIYPQVGDERIEFGQPENLEAKFRKLKIFYKEILPRVGWNKYDRVNLEYEGQIIAE